ncbi:flagellin [Bacillus paranthracis]|uniref:flagellin N-terminal helical domain-containing protein n=1 Tax=Bacillus cereus group TaxID=86661 RepID=UPI0022E8A52B|nr:MULTISPECIES: flagellin [Bacillus cereus group]MDA1745634.1 flagellin [Bacillus cereus group sp. LD121LC]MDK7420655.1 flagellin [Bacillus paranthracis]MDK7428175.1 flagellin [Bacillus paranthracis]MDK7518525.1 flagellin [Bacillus paranthracis]MDK7573555.1 flagellin [Bacillus paranthracis]
MRINTNINSMRTQEYMRQNQAKMSNAMDRLSSGKRINNASDDAAGLAIATRMRARESGLNVAADNTQNGMSLIRTADSAMNSVSNILLRMRDIANQSANGTNTDSNKSALQKEFAELQKQITYIADNTQFNDKNLLKEDSEVKIQTLDSSKGEQQIGIDLKAVTLEKLGINNISIGKADGTTEGTKADLTALQAAAKKLEKPDTGTMENDVKAAKEEFDKVKASLSAEDANKIEKAFGEFDKAKTDDTKATAIYNAIKDVKLPEKAAAPTPADLTDFKSALNKLETPNPTTMENDVKAAKEEFDKIKTSLSAEDADKIEKAFGEFDKAKTDDSKASAIYNLAKDVKVNATDTTTGTDKDTTTSTDKDAALAAIAAIDAALTKVADNRATLGATLNRLDFNVNNLKSQSSSMASAASQIEDADMAKEMSEMTKFKILNEAGISMLSQANQTPQMVSKLLQ